MVHQMVLLHYLEWFTFYIHQVCVGNFFRKWMHVKSAHKAIVDERCLCVTASHRKLGKLVTTMCQIYILQDIFQTNRLDADMSTQNLHPTTKCIKVSVRRMIVLQLLEQFSFYVHIIIQCYISLRNLHSTIILISTNAIMSPLFLPLLYTYNTIPF